MRRFTKIVSVKVTPRVDALPKNLIALNLVQSLKEDGGLEACSSKEPVRPGFWNGDAKAQKQQWNVLCVLTYGREEEHYHM